MPAGGIPGIPVFPQKLKELEKVKRYRRAGVAALYETYRPLLSVFKNEHFEEGTYMLQNVIDKEGAADVTDDLILCLKRSCVAILLGYVHARFLMSPEYQDLCTDLEHYRNRVGTDDFVCGDIIAEGGFGVVIHCRKRSTGQEYAMKVQPKAKILRHFRKDPSKVALEMQAYSLCEHPFLCELVYAFHSERLAFLVFPLARAGDLRHSLKVGPGAGMSLERVRFYALEIISALLYLHSFSVLYRDLKPANVLLNSDGHICLADFGSIADIDHSISSVTDSSFSASDTHSYSHSSGGPSALLARSPLRGRGSSSRVQTGRGLFAAEDRSCSLPDFACSELPDLDVSEGELDRRMNLRTLSLVGTVEYMAPEVIVMFGNQTLHAGGYTDAVDWWGLGVTMYKLLTGVEPFHRISHKRLTYILAPRIASRSQYEQVFTAVFGEVNYELPALEEAPLATDLIRALLKFDPVQRLGSGSSAPSNTPKHTEALLIKDHPFFHGVDWEAVETKGVSPPPVPAAELLSLSQFRSSSGPVGKCLGQVSSDLQSILHHNGRSSWLSDQDGDGGRKFSVDPEDQVCFRSWNYCSSAAIEQEEAALPKL